MGQQTSHQCHDGPVNAVASLDASSIVVSGGSDGVVCRHEPGTEPQSLTDIGAAISAMEALPGGGLLVGCEDGTLAAISIDDAGVTAQPEFHTGLVSAIEVLPALDRALTTSYDGTIGVWELDSWQPREKLVDDALAPIVSATVDPAEEWFATSGIDAPVRIWGTDDYATLTTLADESETMVDMVTTPDSTQLLGLNYEGRIETWGTEIWGTEGAFQTSDSGEGQLALHPEGQHIAVRESQGVSLFTLGGEIATHFGLTPGRVASLHFAADGTILRVGCEDGRVVSLEIDLEYQQDTYHLPE